MKPARPMRPVADIVILGGGLTGISAALHARRPWVLLEKESRLGGHARTDQRDGYSFDKTGHWLHPRHPATQALIQELPGDQMVRIERRARIFSHGTLTRFPFQANLYGLPPEVARECLLGFIEAWHRRQVAAPSLPANFEEFIHQQFGAGIARHFMIPYNHKLWGVHPREITAEWCTRFVPVPRLDDVVRGAVGDVPPEMGYNISFLYPRKGGIETMTRALTARIQSGKILTGADPKDTAPVKKTLRLGGETLSYSSLVATLPLPELCRRMVGLPQEVERAAAALRCTPVRYLNVATKSPP